MKFFVSNKLDIIDLNSKNFKFLFEKEKDAETNYK